jgi:hypothetical protein
MPNWCQNILTVTHKDAEQIQRVKTAFNQGELLQEFAPVPEALKITCQPGTSDEALQALYEANQAEYGYSTWYDYCVGVWGTKWDVGGSDAFSDINETVDGIHSITLHFDSAWSPPLGVYPMLEEAGFDVLAYYYEGGMQFAGIYTNGSDDYYQDWGDAQGAEDQLPTELNDTFGISEMQAEWEADEAEADE